MNQTVGDGIGAAKEFNFCFEVRNEFVEVFWFD